VTEVNKGSPEVIKGGPLVEYARRIASGELLDGDLCQVRVVIKTRQMHVLKLIEATSVMICKVFHCLL